MYEPDLIVGWIRATIELGLGRARLMSCKELRGGGCGKKIIVLRIIIIVIIGVVVSRGLCVRGGGSTLVWPI